MRLKYFFLIASSVILNVGCTSTTGNSKVDSSPLDTTQVIELVAKEILSELDSQVIIKSQFLKDGDYYIEFHPDTTNANLDDLIKESYTIRKETIKTGLLNNDEFLDVTIQSIWGPVSGNMYGLHWHILISTDSTWKSIANSFGGGKFSSIENITEINEGKIITELIEFDQELFSHTDHTKIRTFKLTEDTLTEK